MHFLKSLLNIILESSTVRKISGAMFTQGLLSITNLIVGVLVARHTAKAEYGMYVIALSLINASISYQNALINTPLTVLSAAKEQIQRDDFVTGLRRGQWLFLLPLLLILISGSYVYSLYKQEFLLFSQVLILSVAIVAYFAREFQRTVNYSYLEIRKIIIMDVVFAGTVLLAIGILTSSVKLSSQNVLLALAGGSAFATFIGGRNNRTPPEFLFSKTISALTEAWHYGRWALVGVTATIIQSRGYVYIVSFTIGLDEIANIAAARLFLMPVGLCIGSSMKIVMAKGANLLHQSGTAKLKHLIFAVTAFLFSAWLVVVTILWLSYDELLRLVYNGKYDDIQWYLLLWGIFFLFELLRFPLSASMQIFKRFKELAIIGCIASTITLVACFILTTYFDGYGAIMSIIAGAIVLLILCGVKVGGYFKSSHAG